VTDFLMKPFDPEELVTRVESLLRSKRYTDALEEATDVVVALAQSLDARDHYTAGYSERVSLFATLLGERLACPSPRCGCCASAGCSTISARSPCAIGC
jgi:response regulator RpfG family c-di-GMP phosphodiesterase